MYTIYKNIPIPSPRTPEEHAINAEIAKRAAEPEVLEGMTEDELRAHAKAKEEAASA